jgi:hypothetical protein
MVVQGTRESPTSQQTVGSPFSSGIPGVPTIALRYALKPSGACLKSRYENVKQVVIASTNEFCISPNGTFMPGLNT